MDINLRRIRNPKKYVPTKYFLGESSSVVLLHPWDQNIEKN
jgi:hypothetical protein